MPKPNFPKPACPRCKANMFFPTQDTSLRCGNCGRTYSVAIICSYAYVKGLEDAMHVNIGTRIENDGFAGNFPVPDYTNLIEYIFEAKKGLKK